MKNLFALLALRSIRGRIVWGGGIIVAIIVIIGWTTATLLGRIDTLTDRIVHVDGRRHMLAADIAIQALQCRRYEKDMFLNVAAPAAFADYRKKWVQAVFRLHRIAEQLEQVPAAPGGAGGVATVAAGEPAWGEPVRSYERACRAVLARIDGGEIVAAAAANDAMAPHKHAVPALTDQAVAIQARAANVLQQARRERDAVFDTAKAVLAAGAGVAVVLALIWILCFPRYVLAPVRMLGGTVARMAAGDLSARVRYTSADEMGRLAAAFDAMADALERRTGELGARNSDLEAARARLDAQARSLDRARELAESGSRAKSTFLRSMSHEFRTPLTAIIGYAELLPDVGPAATRGGGDEGGTDVGDLAADIRRSGRQLLAIVQQVLDYADADAGGLTPVIAPTDVAAVARRAADAVAAAARGKGIGLAVLADPAAPATVATDAARLEQILRALLDNAVRYTPAGGDVTVRLRAGAGLTLDVTDTGPGIPPDRLDQLFLPFRPLDAGGAGRTVGLGLGLATARRLAELLGGALTVASAPGRGTTFTMTLAPMATTPLLAAAA